MTYKGHVKNGAVVLDDPVELPEGALVKVDIVKAPAESDDESMPALADTLAPFIGKAVGLPKDAAENHDHYLYGTPKK